MSDFELPKDKQTKSNSKVEAVTKDVPTEEKVEVPKSKYSPEELLQIFDDMLFAGSYAETMTIRGKLKITFRTRSAEEMDSITRAIDGTTAVLMATLVEKRNLLNLYHALVSYQGKDISGLKLEDRTTFINKLPAPIVGMMMVALFDFDNKINEATKEGETNF